MNQTIYEKGRVDERMELICALVEDRFGSVPETVRRELEQMPAEQVRHLALKISAADSLADLGLTGSQPEG